MTDAESRIHDLAHLGHHCLRTPDPDRTVGYFVDLLGMDVVARQGDATYLRTFGDYERWSLKVVASHEAGLEYASWRTRSPEALDRRVAWLESHGYGGAWTEEFAIGPCYSFQDPDGHPFRLYYETERYVPTGADTPALPTSPQAYAGRGANVRRLDHVNLLARDVRRCREFWEDGFGLRTYEVVLGPDGVAEAGAWMSGSIQGHELIYTQERSTGSGRLHHLAYCVDSREEVLRAATIFADAGVRIEAGPSQHTAIQGFYLYTREPGGNRVEIANGGYLVFAPDHETFVWDADRWETKPGWGARIPPEFHTYGTPDIT
ncbi:VOC family protein [Umezawaea tangerina]|uniref:Catechol 2,3-dioxygenase n=1 Tax=Umezawaea tangerina TaxID=84725 RepID=A0A2T0T6P8_9PSEU|nr:VOC family protein [Umezawaea tangerina]PRY41311.1 catechol 2,3-dioxygenase [Umezawaea tangerina]